MKRNRFTKEKGPAPDDVAKPEAKELAPKRSVRIPLKDFKRYEAAQLALRGFQQANQHVFNQQQLLVNQIDMLVELFGERYGLREGDQIEAEDGKPPEPKTRKV